MSTKTTIKRVALVTVAALGFGMLSTGVAQAVASTYTSGTALSTTNMTVVSTTTSAMRLKVVFVDICFLSISRSREFPSFGFEVNFLTSVR